MNSTAFENLPMLESFVQPYEPLEDSSLQLSELEEFIRTKDLKRPKSQVTFSYGGISPSIYPFPFISLPTLRYTKFEGEAEIIQRSLVQVMPVEEAQKHYEDNKDMFLQNYEGRYVAILDKNTIEVGEDIIAVANHVYDKFGYQDVFITKVTREPEIVRLTRPRILK